jgi:MFS family permease
LIAVGPLLGAAFVELATDFNVDLSTFISGVQGGLIVAIAFGSLICNALAVKFGKRPVFLATTIGLTVTCFWAAAAKSFVSLVAARVVQGFCMGPLEALVPASIADVWYVHQRGYRTAIFNLGVLGGINLAAPIAGAIIQYSGWQTAFYAMGGAFGVTFVMMLFWMPETAFVRTGTVVLDINSNTVESEMKNRRASIQQVEVGEKVAITTSTTLSETSVPQEQPLPFAKQLLPYSGYVNHVNFFNTLFRPFKMIGSPSIIWATILFTTCISWLVGISITLSQIFSAPPYNFSVTAVGLTNLSAFAASMIATLVAGPLIDGLVRRMSKANKGIFGR